MAREKQKQTREYEKIKPNIQKYFDKKKKEGLKRTTVFIKDELADSAKENDMTLSDFINNLYKNAVED